MDYNAAALKMHSEHRGKIEIRGKVAVKTRDDLSTAYTPGVAEPCRRIAADPAAAWEYTAKGPIPGTSRGRRCTAGSARRPGPRDGCASCCGSPAQR